MKQKTYTEVSKWEGDQLLASLSTSTPPFIYAVAAILTLAIRAAYRLPPGNSANTAPPAQLLSSWHFACISPMHAAPLAKRRDRFPRNRTLASSRSATATLRRFCFLCRGVRRRNRQLRCANPSSFPPLSH